MCMYLSPKVLWYFRQLFFFYLFLVAYINWAEFHLCAILFYSCPDRSSRSLCGPCWCYITGPPKTSRVMTRYKAGCVTSTITAYRAGPRLRIMVYLRTSRRWTISSSLWPSSCILLLGIMQHLQVWWQDVHWKPRIFMVPTLGFQCVGFQYNLTFGVMSVNLRQTSII